MLLTETVYCLRLYSILFLVPLDFGLWILKGGVIDDVATITSVLKWWTKNRMSESHNQRSLNSIFSPFFGFLCCRKMIISSSMTKIEDILTEDYVVRCFTARAEYIALQSSPTDLKYCLSQLANGGTKWAHLHGYSRSLLKGIAWFFRHGLDLIVVINQPAANTH